MSLDEKSASINELSTIVEAPVVDRKLSGSPEPIDPQESKRFETENRGSSADIPLPPNAITSKTTLRDGPSISEKHVRQNGAAFSRGNRTHTSRTSQSSSRRSTAEGITPFQDPLRQSTGLTSTSASFEETEAWDRKAILTLGMIDGGGIRGYSSLLIIRELMKRIADLEQKYPEDPASTSFHPLSPPSRNGSAASEATLTSETKSHFLPCHYFDYMAGTSTGGLIAIMLGRLRMNIDDCIADYEKLGNDVFGHSRWFHLRSPFFWPRDKYNHGTLLKVIKGVVDDRVPRVASFPGGRNFAYDENRCRTVVVAYQRNTAEGIEKPYLFRTYKNLHKSPPNSRYLPLDRNPNLAHDIPIWEVGRATTAAPSYFEPAIIDGLEYVDGGFGANNPSQEAHREVRRMNNNSESAIGILVSVGTGVNRLLRFTDHTGLLRYFHYLSFMKKWTTESEKTHEEMLEFSRDKFNYHRFNVAKCIGTMKLDEWRTRGKCRRGLGVLIGKMRGRSPDNDCSHGSKQTGETVLEREVNRSNSYRGDDRLRIPTWFKARNKTIETMSKHTMDYLNQPDVIEWLNTCADYLVEGRRCRVKTDRERWERACYGAWYQCTQDQCPRGEKEYESRDSLRAHFLDKHRNIFSRSPTERSKLEKGLDDCKIMVE